MNNKRQALVTGANKGIGLAIARGLAEAGFFVWIGPRDRARGELAVADLRVHGLDVGLIELDVADEASVHRATATLTAQMGKVRGVSQATTGISGSAAASALSRCAAGG